MISEIPKSYGGFCPQCQTHHHLPSEQALPFAQSLIQELKTHECLDFELPEHSRSLEFKTDNLYVFSGQMLGVLLYKDKAGVLKVAKAFSGTHYGHWLVPGWVAPTIDVTTYAHVLEDSNDAIHPLNELIDSASTSDSDKIKLKKERLFISQNLHNQFRNSYEFYLPNQSTIGLFELMNHQPKIPMGTGDCAAPKLLSFANKRGFTPISLIEFYWGKTSKDGLKEEGIFYPACAERCQKILGTLLCKHLKE